LTSLSLIYAHNYSYVFIDTPSYLSKPISSDNSSGVAKTEHGPLNEDGMHINLNKRALKPTAKNIQSFEFPVLFPLALTSSSSLEILLDVCFWRILLFSSLQGNYARANREVYFLVIFSFGQCR
jgi:hypothetical protein